MCLLNFYGKICSKSFEFELKKLKKEHLHVENEYIHEGKENFQVEKEYGHEEKENIHEENYNVHEGKVYVQEDYVTANPDGTFRIEVYDEEIQPEEPEPVHEEKQPEEIEPFHDVKQPNEIKPLHEGKQPEEIAIVHQENVYEVDNPGKKEQKSPDKKNVTYNPHEKYKYMVMAIYGPDSTKFKCTICSAVFNILSNANRHFQTVHEKLMPFECAVCKRCFSTKQVLITHNAKVHAGKKPFECSQCDEKYKRKTALRKHISEFHKKSSAMKKYTGKRCFSNKHAKSISKAKNSTKNGKETTSKENVIGDHSYITSSHFWDFWTPLPPYVSMFLVLRISKNWHFLTPLPPYKC